MDITRTKLKKWLDSQEFYELCQSYRITPVEEQAKVIEAFKAIKSGVLKATRGPR